MAEPFTLFLNGSYGVGKSAVLESVGDLLAAAAVPFTLMDVDWFHRSWPIEDDDPHHHALEARSMAAAWAEATRRRQRQLVVAGVLAEPADPDRYIAALGQPLRSVRLVADPVTTERRLRGRYPAERRQALDWHLTRYRDTAARLARAGLDEAVLDTVDRSAAEVARAVLEVVGLLQRRDTHRTDV